MVKTFSVNEEEPVRESAQETMRSGSRGGGAA